MQPAVHLSFSGARILWILAGLGLGLQPGQAQSPRPVAPLARLEQAWLELRTLDDQLRTTRSLGAANSPRGMPLDSLVAGVGRASSRVHALAAQVDRVRLDSADARAFAVLTGQLASLRAESAAAPARAGEPSDCALPFPERLRGATLDSITAHTFTCYGAAARRIVVEADTLDRLSILGLLGRTDDPERRRRLFLALTPVWQSVNGDDGQNSPYRTMVRLRRAGWGSSSPMDQRAPGLGVAPDTLEQWLVTALPAWRADNAVTP